MCLIRKNINIERVFFMLEFFLDLYPAIKSLSVIPKTGGVCVSSIIMVLYTLDHCREGM